MTSKEIMAELKSMGSENIRKIYLKHGIKEPMFGVKVEQLKTIQKKVKQDYQLAKDLFATGNSDAMYLAGLIADDAKMTRSDLQDWVNHALSQNISEYTVPWVTCGNENGFKLAIEWIDSDKPHVAAAGWSTLGGIVSLKPDAELDINQIKKLLKRVVKEIHAAPNRVRYTMNGFVIAVGAYISGLTAEALEAGQKIGNVTVDMNGTACKVPQVADYISKIRARGLIGRKKKTVKC